jgi:hypothetical protein
MTAGLAVLLFAASLSLHFAAMPRGSLAAIRDMKPARLIGLTTYLYFGALYWLFATTMFRLHPPMGPNWAARVCRSATIWLCIAVAELFVFAGSALIHPPIREFGAYVWLGALVAGTVLAPLMLWTLAEATRKRQLEQERKALEALAFLGEEP